MNPIKVDEIVKKEAPEMWVNLYQFNLSDGVYSSNAIYRTKEDALEIANKSTTGLFIGTFKIVKS